MRESGDPVEHGLLRSPIQEVAHRDFISIVHLAPGLRVGLPQGHESFRLGVRERAQENGADDTEDCSVGPDAKRKRSYRDESEGRSF